MKFGRDGKDEPSKDTDPAAHPVLVLAAAGLCDVVDTGPTGGEVVTPPVGPPFELVMPPPAVSVAELDCTVISVGPTVGEMMVVF